MNPSDITAENSVLALLTICGVIVAVACLIASEIIMNAKKKHYPEGAKIKKPLPVILLQVASAVAAIPLVISIVQKMIDLFTGNRENLISTVKLLGQGFACAVALIDLPLFVQPFVQPDAVRILRGTPLMLQLLLVYFGPYYLFGVTTGNIQIGPFNYRFIATVIGFSLNYAAYFAEIFRGGIQSMSKGQYEAAQVLGFTKSQTYFKIILPQVVKRVLPSVGNEIITLVKDTSLAQVLAVTEMFTQASALASAQVSVMPFIVAGLFYYLMNLVIETLLGLLEKSMNYYS